MASRPSQSRHDRAVDTGRAHVERELIRLLRRTRATLAAYAVAVHPHLDVAGYALLMAVVDCEQEAPGADVRVSGLAGRLALHKSTLSRGLATLERLGLVDRVQDPADARARLVRLTAQGRAGVARLRTERLARLARVLDSWPEPELQSFARQLERLNSALDAPE